MEGEAQLSDSPDPNVPARRRSYQFRALSRRAATHHRRHWKLDICCLGLCPGYARRFIRLMVRLSVIIAGILGIVAQRFDSATPSSQTFLGQGTGRRRICFAHGARRSFLFEH